MKQKSQKGNEESQKDDGDLLERRRPLKAPVGRFVCVIGWYGRSEDSGSHPEQAKLLYMNTSVFLNGLFPRNLLLTPRISSSFQEMSLPHIAYISFSFPFKLFVYSLKFYLP
jgi:hypothetical protein